MINPFRWSSWKGVVIAFVIILGISWLSSAFKSSNSAKPPIDYSKYYANQTPSPAPSYSSVQNSNSSPQPRTSTTISFNLKQQCADDTNRFLIQKNQDLKNTGYSGNVYLLASTYNSDLNTCLVEVNMDTKLTDGSPDGSYSIFDVLSGKLLAFYDYKGKLIGNSTGLIPGHTNPTLSDYIKYRTSLGL